MKNETISYNKLYVLSITLVAAMGGLLFGYNLGIMTGVQPFIRVAFSLQEGGLYEGFVVAVFALGCMCGALGTSKLADLLGRKKMLLFTAFFLIVTAVGVAFSPNAEWFSAWRFLQGICVGAVSVLTPMYIAEVSPSSERGKYVAINQLTIIIGILLSTIVCWFYSERLQLDKEVSWQWMLGTAAPLATIFILALIAIPETPRWLVRANRKDTATKVIARIGGSNEEQQKELKEIEASLTGSAETHGTYSELFGHTLFPALLVGVGIAFFQQFCGANGIIAFMQEIFKSAKMALGEGLLNAVFVNVVALFTTILSLFLVDRVGRRRLMLIGMGTIAATLVALVWAFSRELINGPLVLVLIMAHTGAFGLTLGPVVWVLLSEIFPNRVRSKAMSLSSFTVWLSCFVVILISPPLLDKGPVVTFTFFAFFTTLGFVFCYFFVPETKGKSLEEIEEIWKNRAKKER